MSNDVKDPGGKGFKFGSGSKAGSRVMLIGSNIAYIAPIVIAVIKYIKGDIPFATAVELIVLFIAVILASSNYHWCHSKFSADYGDKEEVNFLQGDDCYKCPTGNGMTISKASFLDHFLAMYAIGITVLHMFPIKMEYMIMLRVLLFVFILFIQVFSGMKLFFFNADKLSIIPILVLLIFWGFQAFRDKILIQKEHKKFYIGAIIVGMISIGLFGLLNRPYWLFHSLWHIMGAITSCLIIWTMDLKNNDELKYQKLSYEKMPDTTMPDLIYNQT
jgi:hypothetical protein